MGMEFFLPDIKMNHQPSKLMGTPSQLGVIARLMGMDAIPVQVKAAEETISPKPPPASNLVCSTPFKQVKFSLLPCRSRTGDSRHYLKKMRSRSRRRHPQEHLLQKIKEDFQSWQASNAALGNNSKQHLDGRRIQIVAQENLCKEKMARYGYVNNKMAMQKGCPVKNVVQTSGSAGKAAMVRDEEKSEKTTTIRVLRVNHCTTLENLRNLDVGKDGHNQSTSEELHSPAHIVLLKPSYDIDVDDGHLLFDLSKGKRDDNMEEFLHHVKERLQEELKVNLKNITWGAEPKHAAMQLKHTVTTDLGKRLSRSEAFRAFRSDRKHITSAKHASPEHVKMKMRDIHVHRPKNVTPQTEIVSPKKDGEESVNSFPIKSRKRIISLTDMRFGEHTCTSSECLIEDNVGDTVILPQCKLVRSFSAPELVVSRITMSLDESVGNTSHGASDVASESDAMTSRRSSFNLKETLSSLRHRLSFRGKLFGRKKKQELDPQLAISMSPSQSFKPFNFPQAAFAELPPSPASPLEIIGYSSRHFFRDLNCSLPELSRNCPLEFEAPANELSFRTDITVETTCNQDKDYLREVLIAARLYDDGSIYNKANTRVDSMARPICDYIFEEVEDIYYYRDKSGDHERNFYNTCGGNTTDHRMLFDLANEALQTLVLGAKSGNSLSQWLIGSTGVSLGRNLVDDVWQQVQALRYSQMQEMQTIDSMVAFEVRKSLWGEVLYEDVYVVGKKIELAIFDELIEDLLLKVFYS